jgi:hypothetical protein
MVAERPRDDVPGFDSEFNYRLWCGKVPWTMEGLLEALEEANRAKVATGSDSTFYMMMWVQDRYGGDLGMAHSVRFQAAVALLREHAARLMDEDLVRKSADGKSSLVSHHLAGALAEAEYTREVPDADCAGGVRHELDIDHVIALAKRGRGR